MRHLPTARPQRAIWAWSSGRRPRAWRRPAARWRTGTATADWEPRRLDRWLDRCPGARHGGLVGTTDFNIALVHEAVLPRSGTGRRSSGATAGSPTPTWPTAADGSPPTCTPPGWGATRACGRRRAASRPRPRGPLPPQRQRVPRGDAGRPRRGCAPLTSTTATWPRSCVTSSSTAGPGRSCTTARSRPRCARCCAGCPSSPLLLQVDDDSGTPLLPGAVDYEAALAAADPRPPRAPQPDDLYILYTGGTTGMPKGVLWRQADFLAACLGIGDRIDHDELVERRAAVEPPRPARPARSCTAPPTGTPFSAGSAAARVIVRRPSGAARSRTTCSPRSSASGRRRCSSSATPSPARSSTRSRSGDHDVSSLRHLLTGGATLSARRQGGAARAAARPADRRRARLVRDRAPGRRRPPTGRGGRHGHLRALAHQRRARRGPRPRARARRRRAGLARPDGPGAAAATSATREKTRPHLPEVDGVRHAVPGDRARVLAERLGGAARPRLGHHQHRRREGLRRGGRAGRQAPPGVFDVVVVGRPSERWGRRSWPSCSSRDGPQRHRRRPAGDRGRARRALQAPKAVVRRRQVERSPSGKPDYRWARAVAEDASG